MKLRLSSRRNTAMTLFEVGVLVAVVMVLVIVFLPRISRPAHRYAGIACVNNLKQLGLAYRIWAGDNNDQYPMAVALTNGGSFELAQTGDLVQTYLVMSNELSTPRILHCPEDRLHTTAVSFSTGLMNRDLSYFVGVDATNEVNPQLIISGDSHLRYAGKLPLTAGLQSLGTNDPISWSNMRHIDPVLAEMGNIGLIDGSVQSADSKSVREYFIQTGIATNRLAIP